MLCKNKKLVMVFLFLFFLIVFGCYEKRVETISINNLTMSAIVFADLNTVEDVQAEVVFDDTVIENLEKTMGAAISNASNEYIQEKEKELQVKTICVNGINLEYDSNLLYINKDNIKDRFKIFAPYDDYEKVIKALGQMAQGEAGGCSHTEIAATMWSVLNRYDKGYSESIFTIIAAPGQYHGYHSWIKVRDDIKEISEDVIARWVIEKEGGQNVGRVLPSGYCWFYGDGKHNYFRNSYVSNSVWDWSLPTPYKN